MRIQTNIICTCPCGDHGTSISLEMRRRYRRRAASKGSTVRERMIATAMLLMGMAGCVEIPAVYSNRSHSNQMN